MVLFTPCLAFFRAVQKVCLFIKGINVPVPELCFSCALTNLVFVKGHYDGKLSLSMYMYVSMPRGFNSRMTAG